jgi:hypothetical protein
MNASAMFQRVLCILPVLLIGTALAQETASDSDPSEKAAEADDASAIGETCFNAKRANDLSVLTDQHVYIRTVGHNHYLLTMDEACDNFYRSSLTWSTRPPVGGRIPPGDRFVPNVWLVPYGSDVCPNDGSHFVYRWYGRERVCSIMTITAVENRAEAREMARGTAATIRMEEIPVPE